MNRNTSNSIHRNVTTPVKSRFRLDELDRLSKFGGIYLDPKFNCRPFR